jgi:hypothetical protein
MAWDYFFTMHRDAKDRYALDHAFVGLVKGMEEN